MATTVTVACPECDKQSRVPAEYAGKKVRCRQCQHVFVVKLPRSAAPPGKPAKPVPDDDEDENSEEGYGLVTVELTPRCPLCAYELESENQRICLNCGYDLKERIRREAKKVYETTAWDVFVWLLPGILCVLVIIALIVTDVICYMNMNEWLKGTWLENDDGTWIIKPNMFTLYICLFSAFIAIPLGKFAWRRLVINNTPPEVEKR